MKAKANELRYALVLIRHYYMHGEIYMHKKKSPTNRIYEQADCRLSTVLILHNFEDNLQNTVTNSTHKSQNSVLGNTHIWSPYRWEIVMVWHSLNSKMILFKYMNTTAGQHAFTLSKQEGWGEGGVRGINNLVPAAQTHRQLSQELFFTPAASVLTAAWWKSCLLYKFSLKHFKPETWF